VAGILSQEEQQMKIQKGQKLTEEQKRQRAEARERNKESCMARQEEARRILREQKDKQRTEADFLNDRFISLICTKEEYDMLQFINRRYFPNNGPKLESAATWALRFALSHPKQYSDWVSFLHRYSRAEGVNQTDFVNRQIGELAWQSE
jgi:hypothetical protein